MRFPCGNCCHIVVETTVFFWEIVWILWWPWTKQINNMHFVKCEKKYQVEKGCKEFFNWWTSPNSSVSVFGWIFRFSCGFFHLGFLTLSDLFVIAVWAGQLLYMIQCPDNWWSCLLHLLVFYQFAYVFWSYSVLSFRATVELTPS